MSQQGNELNGRLGEAIDPLLPVSRVVRARQEAGIHQARQPVGQDIRRDSFFGEPEEISIVATIAEHDVPDHYQAPTIAQHFQCQIDWAAGAPCVLHHYRRLSTSLSIVVCNRFVRTASSYIVKVV